jgi:predicted TIM-barrel fold metal-dependent hydrolase
MIDFHTHPVLVREVVGRDEALLKVVREVFKIGNRLQPLETFHLELDVSGLERAVLLPIDCSTSRGCQIFSNEQIAELCQMSDRFIGFASVDPHKKSAANDLERAVNDLGLRGIKLSPPTQEFYPHDKKLAYPIYERAQSLGIPALFHGGMSWEPQAKAQYGQPIHLEDVAYDFPDLNVVIAHFGWPWVPEAAMLALKYPNVYMDTSCLYFDNPVDFLAYVMKTQIPISLVERGLRHKVIFGSNYPRVEIKNMAKAVRRLGLTRGCLELIFRDNALRLLGEVSA